MIGNLSVCGGVEAASSVDGAEPVRAGVRWQHDRAGERRVRQAARPALLRLHQRQVQLERQVPGGRPHVGC